MSRTLVEQIISHAVGHSVAPGDMETVPVDIVMIHDSIAHIHALLLNQSWLSNAPSNELCSLSRSCFGALLAAWGMLAGAGLR